MALPAIETLNNKKEMTRRYWIFYNHFLRRITEKGILKESDYAET